MCVGGTLSRNLKVHGKAQGVVFLKAIPCLTEKVYGRMDRPINNQQDQECMAIARA